MNDDSMYNREQKSKIKNFSNNLRAFCVSIKKKTVGCIGVVLKFTLKLK